MVAFSDEEKLVRPNIGRHVVFRTETRQHKDTLLDGLEHDLIANQPQSRDPTHCDPSATVPATPGALCAAGVTSEPMDTARDSCAVRAAGHTSSSIGVHPNVFDFMMSEARDLTAWLVLTCRWLVRVVKRMARACRQGEELEQREVSPRHNTGASTPMTGVSMVVSA